MTGRPEAARAIATRALALPRDNAVLLDRLGASHDALDEQALAIECSTRRSRCSPARLRCYFNRALAQKHFGQLAGAERDLEKCLALNPAHGKAHWALAEMLPRGPVDNHVRRCARSCSSRRRQRAGGDSCRCRCSANSTTSAATRKPGRARARHRQPARALAPRGAAIRARFRRAAAGPAGAIPRRPGARRSRRCSCSGMPGSGVRCSARCCRGIRRCTTSAPVALRAPAVASDRARQLAPFDAAAIERFARVDFDALGRDTWPRSARRGARTAGVREPADELPAGALHRARAAQRALPARHPRPDRQLRVDPRPSRRRASLPRTTRPARLAYLDYRRLMLHWGELLPGRIME
jgi:hypothetical protein